MELSIILIIMSLMVGGVLNVLSMTVKKNEAERTRHEIQVVKNAIENYLKFNEVLPCPASLTAPSNSSQYGVSSNCAVANATHNAVDSTSGTADILVGRKAVIRVGAVPTRTLGIDDKYSSDGWNNRLAYVVVKSLATTKASFLAYSSAAGGDIELKDINERTLSNNPVGYLLISYGKTAVGAYNSDGINSQNCPSTTSSRPVNYNCQYSNNIFIEGTINVDASSSKYNQDIIDWELYSDLYKHFKQSAGAAVPNYITYVDEFINGDTTADITHILNNTGVYVLTKGNVGPDGKNKDTRVKSLKVLTPNSIVKSVQSSGGTNKIVFIKHSAVNNIIYLKHLGILELMHTSTGQNAWQFDFNGVLKVNSMFRTNRFRPNDALPPHFVGDGLYLVTSCSNQPQTKLSLVYAGKVYTNMAALSDGDEVYNIATGSSYIAESPQGSNFNTGLRLTKKPSSVIAVDKMLSPHETILRPGVYIIKEPVANLKLLSEDGVAKSFLPEAGFDKIRINDIISVYKVDGGSIDHWAISFLRRPINYDVVLDKDTGNFKRYQDYSWETIIDPAALNSPHYKAAVLSISRGAAGDIDNRGLHDLYIQQGIPNGILPQY